MECGLSGEERMQNVSAKPDRHNKPDREAAKVDVILACGGTGGHMFPAFALARELTENNIRVAIHTDERGLRYKAKNLDNIPMDLISSATFKKGLKNKIRTGFILLCGYFEAKRSLRDRDPDLVVGFGGYPSLPTILAAQREGYQTMLHEQNATLGRANLFLSKHADKIALSVRNVKGFTKDLLQKSVITGNPVREEFVEARKTAYTPIRPEGPIRIVVIGGSLGAGVFGEIVPATLASLPAEYRKRLKIVQQSRAEDQDQAIKTYKDAGIEAQVESFLHDVAGHMKDAHVIISRSGASSVAEITAVGRPAIFVPYPWHKDQQQKINADIVAEQGGGWVIPQDGFTVEVLKARLEMFFQNPALLSSAAEKSRKSGNPEAAKSLTKAVMEML